MFFLTAVILVTLEFAIFRFITSRAESEYLLRYGNFTAQIGDTLMQIDKLSDSMLLNAAYVLREKEKTAGLPSNESLMSLKDDLSVRSLSILDSGGNFLRSDWSVAVEKDPKLKAHYNGKSAISKSIFTYCQDYRKLVTGRSSLEKTPVIPSGSGGFPGKFLLIPNSRGTRILEVNMLMSSIGEILSKAMRPDASVISIGLFTPTGVTLGYVPPEKINTATAARLEQGVIPFTQPQISKSGFVFFSKIPTTTADCCECKTKGITAPDGSYYYILRMEVSRAVLNSQLSRIRRWFFGIGFLGLALSGAIAYFISRRLVQKLVGMSEKVKKIAESDNMALRLNVTGHDEVATLAQRFDAMMEQLANSRLRLAAAEREKAFSELARQVAHDVRSPLAALETMGNDISILPEQHRAIIRSAVSRVRDIANNLLDKHREAAIDGKTGIDGQSATVINNGCSACLISSLIDPLLTEKRMQFRSNPGIEIEGHFADASYGLFASINPAEFKRVLSNLINNAVEALGEKGSVAVNLSGIGNTAVLEVRDTGAGIAPDLLLKLGKKGETHGKPGGSGLGLFHAITTVESWGGRLEIISAVGKGTTLAITLPLVRPPGWFVPNLHLLPGCTVVVLDDDTSIHQIWQGRFASLRVKNAHIETFYFTTPEELQRWVAENPSLKQNTLYLTDYELQGSKKTGLSMIEELNIKERSILVTSRFEEKHILEDCLKLKVRLIPKGLVGFMPISIVTQQEQLGDTKTHETGPDVILLDDDSLVQLNWKMAAKAKGLNFLGLKNPQELISILEGLPKTTPIYLDSQLRNGIRGENIAKELNTKGFTNLYLATGYSQESFPPLPWIRQVVGKEPPWS